MQWLPTHVSLLFSYGFRFCRKESCQYWEDTPGSVPAILKNVSSERSKFRKHPLAIELWLTGPVQCSLPWHHVLLIHNRQQYWLKCVSGIDNNVGHQEYEKHMSNIYVNLVSIPKNCFTPLAKTSLLVINSKNLMQTDDTRVM